jgi:hypothetical protein
MNIRIKRKREDPEGEVDIQKNIRYNFRQERGERRAKREEREITG